LMRRWLMLPLPQSLLFDPADTAALW
jgi:hypothetical protein